MIAGERFLAVIPQIAGLPVARLNKVAFKMDAGGLASIDNAIDRVLRGW